MKDARRSVYLRIVLWLECLVSFPATVVAGQRTALVESVAGAPQGVESMDYVSVGKVISLGPHEQMVIVYLSSCVRETIAGGSVTIGIERSTVKGGSVERERVRCDGRYLQLSPEQAGKSAGAVFRVPPKSHPLPPGTVINRRLYGTSPIVDLGGANALVIKRLDRTEDPIDLVIPVDQLVRGHFYDFAANDRALSPGGVYRATVGQHSVVFQVDRSAKPGNMPVVGRLLRF